MSSSPEPVEHAVRLAVAYGLAVFPLAVGGRVPARRVRPSTEPAQIRRTWQAAPAANVGVACRASQIVVLDVDGQTGLESWRAACAAHGPEHEDTLTVATPHGRHLYYRAPVGCLIPSTSGGTTPLGAGIDTRAPGRRSGGYVVGPGSVVQGRAYRVVDPAPPAPLPVWLIRALARPSLREAPLSRR